MTRVSISTFPRNMNSNSNLSASIWIVKDLYRSIHILWAINTLTLSVNQCLIRIALTLIQMKQQECALLTNQGFQLRLTSETGNTSQSLRGSKHTLTTPRFCGVRKKDRLMLTSLRWRWVINKKSQGMKWRAGCFMKHMHLDIWFPVSRVVGSLIGRDMKYQYWEVRSLRPCLNFTLKIIQPFG